MRIVPISEALVKDAGEGIPSIQGVITKVDKRVAGGSGDEAWSFQKLTVKDQTGEIVVKVWNREQFPQSLVGQAYLFSCHEGPKGLTGLKIKNDEYRGKVTKQINTSDTANIEPVGAPAPAAAAPNPAPAVAKPDPAPAKPPTEQAKPAPEGAKSSTEERDQKTQAYNAECVKVAKGMFRVMRQIHVLRLAWNKEHPDYVMTPEHFQAACHTAFIEMQKRGFN